MSERKDLTRWNRAGLSRFDYVDGNAVVYLEILRQQLAEKFPGTQWLEPEELVPAAEIPLDGETLLEEQQRQQLIARRSLDSYHQDRRDWGWEVSRTFARACHILTGYADAYANEGTLGTATQWENVRRLVELLDYHPAPPASALTQLAIMAKAAGVVRKGFQVKNSPLFGAQKQIFETLEDLHVDPALNALRPAGWDQSDDPTLPGAGGPGAEGTFSELANEPVISLQGVGPTWRGILDPSSGPEPELRVARIRDFLDLDPRSAAFAAIGETVLRELKAKATLICNFDPGSGWDALASLPLFEIAAKNPADLVAQTGKSSEEVKELQQQIELLGACLDHEVYLRTRLSGVLDSDPATTGGEVRSLWSAPQKPKVLPGQVAMVFHQAQKQAEAVSITRVDEESGAIDLKPSPVQFSWHHWPKGQARLQVAPHWQRECWLNGPKVIRTLEPHGLKAGAFVSWKVGGVWSFAEVIETDTRNLRLKLNGQLPRAGTPLFEGQPLQSKVMASTLEAIGLAGGGDPLVKNIGFKEPPEPAFTMKSPVPNPPEAPAGLPSGSLSFGSFLFPTPLLPMDLVKAAVDLLLNLGVMVIPTTGEVVFKSLPGAGALPTVDDLHALLTGKVDWKAGLNTVTKQKNALAELLQTPAGEPITLFKEILNNLQEKGPLIAVQKNPAVKAIVAAASPLYMFNGSADKLSGDWVVGAFSDGLRALKVSELKTIVASDQSESFSLSFANLTGSVGELQSVYSDFRAELLAEGAGVNSTPVDPALLELAELPARLREGRKVLLTAAGEEAVVATVTAISGKCIITEPPASGFTKGNLVICGNVVNIGHGETKPAKILGSGNAAKSNQEFILEVAGVSFTPAATMSSGVAAAIEVSVAGKIWEQVSTLKNSAPDDHHYAIRMTEEGFVKILFGDGEHGRRLPTGRNNLQVRYRVGSGLAGNLPAHSLEKAVNPHPLVDALLQPVPTAGGGNMEESSSLRENAPPTLLTLERAVSLSDFANLATGRSNIWQARAQRVINQVGPLEQVRVTLVPADGVSSPQILEEVRLFLQSHALPGVKVEVESFLADSDFELKVLLRIRSAEFVAVEVVRAVTTALQERFCLKRSRLGEAFYLSEVYRVVEQITGVENSICTLLRGGEKVQVIKAVSTNRVVYLDSARLRVDAEEYRP